MNNISYIVAALITVSAAIPSSAIESSVLDKAGMKLPSIELPVPATPRNNNWMTLRKITVNEAQPDMNDTLVGLVENSQNIDKVVKELNDNGFKASPFQSNHGGYMVMVDVTGQNAADMAVGLARYFYITEVQVGQDVHNQLFGLNNKSTFAVKMGTIKGGMNSSPVDVKFNKLDWTFTGGMNHSPLDVKINHEEKTITGGANGSPVDLKFDWSTEQVTVYGGANHSEVNYTVNWKNGLLEGYTNNAPVKLEFVKQDGVAGPITTITGYANHAPVELTFNGVNGHLGGGMDNSPVDVTLVNCDLFDFLQYFVLFVK